MSSVMDWDEQRLGRHLKLRDLNVLLAVAKCGSMGKAAVQLSVSQPAISKVIAEMEHTLGVRLLDRSPLGVEPTIYARALLDRGVIAFDELRQALKHIEFLADPSVGELRIGTSIVVATSLVNSVLGQLTRRYPRIVFHLLVADPDMASRALEERKVDLLALHINEQVKEHLQAEVLYDEPFVIVAGARNPWIRRSRIELADLMNEPWTLPPPDSLFGSVIVEAFRASGLDFPRTTVIANTSPARIALVASSRFLTIIPYSLLANHPALKRLPVDLPTATRPVGIFTLKNRTLGPVAQLFIDCARTVAKSMSDQPRPRRA